MSPAGCMLAALLRTTQMVNTATMRFCGGEKASAGQAAPRAPMRRATRSVVACKQVNTICLCVPCGSGGGCATAAFRAEHGLPRRRTCRYPFAPAASSPLSSRCRSLYMPFDSQFTWVWCNARTLVLCKLPQPPQDIAAAGALCRIRRPAFPASGGGNGLPRLVRTTCHCINPYPHATQSHRMSSQ